MPLIGRALEDALREAYGHNWLVDSAADIGCSPRSVWNWAKGGVQPQVRYQGKIRRALVAKADRLMAWADQLHQ